MRRSYALFLTWTLVGGCVFASAEPAGPQVLQASPGPWGELEYFPLQLEPPDRYVATSRDINSHLSPATWRLIGHTRESATSVLQEAGLPEKAIQIAIQSPYFRTVGTDVVINPPPEVIESMTPDMRSRLYPQLSPKSNANVFHDFFVIDKDGFESMAVGAGLRNSIIEMITRLTYPRAGIQVFSDIHLVMQRAANEEERWRILKTLYREQSLSLRIKVSGRSDLAQLADYWSAGGRHKDILPVLESVIITEGVERLDIVHLLPPTPRKLLHTYAHPLMGVSGDLPDCFWTAFNFFSDEPSNRHFDPAAFRLRLGERYEPAVRPFRLGDLVVVYDAAGSGTAHHACSFIADDIVFTKNGGGLLRPWVFTRLDEIVGYYFRSERIRIAFYRLKPGFRE